MQGHVGWGQRTGAAREREGLPSASAAGVEPGKSVASGIGQAGVGVQALQFPAVWLWTSVFPSLITAIATVY